MHGSLEHWAGAELLEEKKGARLSSADQGLGNTTWCSLSLQNKI
jgi:hypothetical protein